jgi:hypothetical protein
MGSDLRAGRIGGKSARGLLPAQPLKSDRNLDRVKESNPLSQLALDRVILRFAHRDYDEHRRPP